MDRKRVLIFLGIVITASMIFAACAPKAPAEPEAPPAVEEPAEPVEEAAPRSSLNPFSNRKIREATNWLFDRNYINQEVYEGGGLPKWFAIQTQGPDYVDLIDVARKLEAKYAYNLEKAREVITAEMEGMGASLVNGKWVDADGQPIVLTFIIRSDSDKTRIPIGEYVAAQLEEVGFTVDRQLKTGGEAAPIWIGSVPEECQWHLYTAAWGASIIDRDEANMFQEMYLPSSQQGIPAWYSNVPDPEFQKLGDELYAGKYDTLEERREMIARALELSLEDSLQVWLIDGKGFVPMRENVVATADLAAGVETGQITPYTLRFSDQEGGSMKWATQELFAEPWNPIGGSNWTFDHGVYGMTMGGDVMYDPFTGLAWPLYLERAEVTVQEGLAVGKTLDWVTLDFAPEIKVPGDAWVDWDAETQTWITADEYLGRETAEPVEKPAIAPAAKTPAVPAGTRKGGWLDEIVFSVVDADSAITQIQAGAIDIYANGLSSKDLPALKESGLKYPSFNGLYYDILYNPAVCNAGAAAPAEEEAEATEETMAEAPLRDVTTAKRKTVLYYPADLYDTVKWHDGSNFSFADVMMGMIMRFDQAKPESAIYDEAAVPLFEAYMLSFKGWRVLSTDPLVVEIYDDQVLTDAELLAGAPPNGVWPWWSLGEGAWHVLAIANAAEAAGECAYTIDKAEPAGIEQTSFIGGPTLEILDAKLAEASAQKLIPYAPTMSAYLTDEDAATRYANLQAFKEKQGHYWIGTGPYYLDKVFLTEKTAVVKYFPDYPYAATRWAEFGEPMVAEAEIEGPDQVAIGEEATFDVYVTFKGEPYNPDDLKFVKAIVYDATGEAVLVKEAQLVKAGQYAVTLTAAETGALSVGVNRLEVAVVSLVVNQPAFDTVQFITQ